MSWLSDYLDYTRLQESPERFHMWSAVAAIGAMLGRKVWLDRRSGGITRYRIYPGQSMIILVGDSGRVRKSTAIRSITPFIKRSGINIVQGKASTEGFLDQLDPSKNSGLGPHSILLEDELSVFLSKVSYAEAIVETLLKLADAGDDFVFHTRNGGKIVIPEPSLTVLAATTPSSIGDSIPPRAQGAGFLGRVIFVYEKDTDRIEDLLDIDDSELDPKTAQSIRACENRLKADIHRMLNLNGPFIFTPMGRAWMKAFYRRWVSNPQGLTEGWPSRRPDHMLRLAMILSASHDDSLELDERVLETTDIMLQQVEHDLPLALAYIGTTATKDRERILSVLQQAGGMTTSQVLWNKVHQYFPDSDSIRRTLHLLQESGIVGYKQRTGSTGRTEEVWFLTTLLDKRARTAAQMPD